MYKDHGAKLEYNLYLQKIDNGLDVLEDGDNRFSEDEIVSFKNVCKANAKLVMKNQSTAAWSGKVTAIYYIAKVSVQVLSIHDEWSYRLACRTFFCEGRVVVNGLS